MPTPCYISITGQTQGNITAGAFTADSVGNIYVQGHEDEMLVQEFLHNVTVPTDPQSGQPAGQRAHKPFIFTVALNKAVPLMYNALASDEMLPTTELHWWRTSVEGKQEHYFTTRLTTIQTGTTRIQTVYQPGSFTPLLRIETENGEQAKARHRSLAEVLQEDTGVTLPAELSVMLGRLERELRAGAVSAESEAWLAQCGLTAEQMAAQLEAEYIPERKLHLYHCDHRGLPLALISPEGETAWQGEYDEWGNLLGETSAQQLQQPYRLPGQQYDEESGLYYNRNRYYDPLQGRYITQDPIGLRGEWNLYKYPLNPVRFIDSLGLKFHVNGDPSDFNQAVEYLKQDSQMKETIDFLSSSEETINIEYIEGTNVRFNSNNMTIYWNSRASLFCSTELNSKSQSPALGLGHEFAHAQYYLLDKENFMALLSRTDKKYENKEEARVITIIESRAAKTLGECTRGAHSGLPFYRVDGPLQTMKITGTPE
ncbi:type VI secretion system tube protein Hcp [Escherichia coli]|nr:type VI secretion system tube protein Hcp [Escherichia coli]EFL6937252.1 type VI secretion system tube protein Hcp [Escherichia coli]